MLCPDRRRHEWSVRVNVASRHIRLQLQNGANGAHALHAALHLALRVKARAEDLSLAQLEGAVPRNSMHVRHVPAQLRPALPYSRAKRARNVGHPCHPCLQCLTCLTPALLLAARTHWKSHAIRGFQSTEKTTAQSQFFQCQRTKESWNNTHEGAFVNQTLKGKATWLRAYEGLKWTSTASDLTRQLCAMATG